MAHDAGKGSNPRPFSVSHDEYAKRWEAIFGNKKTQEQQKQEQTQQENKSENKN